MSGILKAGAGLLVALLLSGCGVGSLLEGDRSESSQPFPANFKPELLGFFRTYLADPVAVRDPFLADPVQRTVGGQPRYISCLKFDARERDGSYLGTRERAVLFIDGRLNRVVDDIGDLCAGASYAPFPALGQMTR